MSSQKWDDGEIKRLLSIAGRKQFDSVTQAYYDLSRDIRSVGGKLRTSNAIRKKLTQLGVKPLVKEGDAVEESQAPERPAQKATIRIGKVAIEVALTPEEIKDILRALR